MNGVIYVAGVYGIGKNTLCKRISRLINIPFYSAGDMISEQIGEKYGKNKKVSNKEHNQDVLIECVNKKLIKNKTLILAGHFCILGNDNKSEELPAYVYEKLGISSIILLETDADIIIEHLKKRDSRNYSRELINDFIIRERKYAMKVSEMLTVPLKIYSMFYSEQDIKNIIDFIKEVYNEGSIRY